MTLPASGAISLANVNTEIGFDSDDHITLDDVGVRALFEVLSGTISLSDGHGKSASGTVTIPINSNTDDVWYRSYDGVFRTTGNYTVVGNVSGYGNYGAFRFNNVTIPQGATIDTAYVTVRAYATDSGSTCNIKIYSEATDDSVTYSTAADFMARSWYVTTVDWNNVSSWTADEAYSTPSLVSIIQLIVNRAGWVSGNSMGMLFANNSSSTNAARYITTVDGYPWGRTPPATLYVAYTP